MSHLDVIVNPGGIPPGTPGTPSTTPTDFDPNTFDFGSLGPNPGEGRRAFERALAASGGRPFPVFNTATNTTTWFNPATGQTIVIQGPPHQ